MLYIKTCPECNRNIRFPLDKGKIKVKCACGYSFIADPDDKSLYRTGKFDLNKNNKRNHINLKQFPDSIIKKLFNAKYTLQNFRLLPSSEQRRIILYLIGYIVLIIGIIYFISSIQCATQSTIQPHTI